MKFSSHALSAVLAIAVSATLLGGCTRNAYIVQNPDGTSSEVPGSSLEPTHGVHVAHRPPTHLHAADDVLAVEIVPANSDVLIDDYEGVVYLQVDIVADELEVVERGPMNVALVVDRSGSMTGAKLESAKAAAPSLVDDLADGDRVALVTYASDAETQVPSTLLSAASRRIFEAAIADLEAVGDTDLGGGLQIGPGRSSKVTIPTTSIGCF
ncbi:MAG: Mg-chelatase subunit ChlD [Myxococcota bacterium]|jgi:Mg-chelatase subunit ChlD